jgi:hypothetical protein
MLERAESMGAMDDAGNTFLLLTPVFLFLIVLGDALFRRWKKNR